MKRIKDIMTVILRYISGLIILLMYLGAIFFREVTLTILLIIFSLFFGIFMICYFYKRIINKKKLKLINSKDIEKVKTYYDKKVFTLLNTDNDELELYDAFETMWDVCGFFLKMNKSIGYKRSEIFTKDDIYDIKRINSSNLFKIYKETEQILDIIYTYYDNDGNRKI